MEAEAADRNAQLGATYAEIDGLLAATLDVDDYVDLEMLRTQAVHPPFDRPDLEIPVPSPVLVGVPREPHFAPPERPSGLRSLIATDQMHVETVRKAEVLYRQEHDAWEQARDAAVTTNTRLASEHEATIAARRAELDRARAIYETECGRREANARDSNAALDRLIEGLSVGDARAVDEYVGIVLSNSIYPDAFAVEHDDYSFSSEDGELKLVVLVPPPAALATTKAFRYQKNIDEVVSTELSQKAQKDRYSGAVHQVALRTLHEVFEADRSGWIRTISMTVEVEAPDPATGQTARIPLVAVAADRPTVESLDLAEVVPAATLKLLRADVSRDPSGLASIGGAGRSVRSAHG